MHNDDSDMKIAGYEFKQDEASDNIEETTLLLKREKSNGNLNRARRLGAIMAEDVAAIEGGHPEDNTAKMMQRRILLAFAVEIGLETLLPNTLLSQTAQSIFYNTLRQTAPAFYEDLQGSGAFSFYYLCVRERKNVIKCVGETYASLCGKAGDKELAEQGSKLFGHFIEQVRTFAENMQFVVEQNN